MLKSNWRADEPATAAECLRRVKDVRSRLHQVNKPTVRVALIREKPKSRDVPVSFPTWVGAEEIAKRIEAHKAQEIARKKFEERVASGEIRSSFDLSPEERDLVMMPRMRAKLLMVEVCQKHFMTPTEILSPRRTINVVIARQELMYRLRAETTWSLPQIGKFLDKDHTTVLHGIRRHAWRNKLPDISAMPGGAMQESENQFLGFQLAAIDVAIERAEQVAA